MLRYSPILAIAALASFGMSLDERPAARIEGELRLWHRITLTFDGPETSEEATPNPFRDYRLTVALQHAATGNNLTVPGYYAADGRAGETAATRGNKWRVHFAADREGEWTYRASFRTGPDVATSLDPSAGQPAAFDGASGRLRGSRSDKTGKDLRARGRLEYVGGHHLRFAASGVASGAPGVRVLARGSDLFAVHLPRGGDASLRVGPGGYSVRWYDPRNGGELQPGSLVSVAGPGVKPIGRPPRDPERDWAALVRKQQ